MAKAFTHYEVIQGQGVIAHFEDGTIAKGTLLVGADGSRSHGEYNFFLLTSIYAKREETVRSQLLQNENPLIQSQFVNVVGELDLTPDEYKPIEELGSAGALVYRPGLRYLIGRLGIDSERQISKYYWAACATSDTPAKDSEWVANAPKEELYKRGVETTKGLPSFLTDIVRATSANQMLQPPLRFVEFHFNGDESLPLADHVTVLGDAAHTMIPFFLAGANSAIKDACDLAKALQKFPGRAGLRRAQETYESIMVKRSKEMVLKSRAQGELDNLNQVLERVK
jgi:2-polyprenyl-6-methoxyphenol hydroxylase-like FAD-dependent oxidoreductase